MLVTVTTSCYLLYRSLDMVKETSTERNRRWRAKKAAEDRAKKDERNRKDRERRARNKAMSSSSAGQNNGYNNIINNNTTNSNTANGNNGDQPTLSGRDGVAFMNAYNNYATHTNRPGNMRLVIDSNNNAQNNGAPTMSPEHMRVLLDHIEKQNSQAMASSERLAQIGMNVMGQSFQFSVMAGVAERDAQRQQLNAIVGVLIPGAAAVLENLDSATSIMNSNNARRSGNDASTTAGTSTNDNTEQVAAQQDASSS